MNHLISPSFSSLLPRVFLLLLLLLLLPFLLLLLSWLGVNSTVILPSHRGKGDYFRLGHGTDAHVRKPQLVEVLKGKKIIHVAVGALHCLCVTDAGQVSSLYSICHQLM